MERFFISGHCLRFAARLVLLSNEQNVQVCDASDDAQGTEAGNKKYNIYHGKNI